MKKVSIITLGCAKNQNDTENLAGLLKKNNLDVVDDAQKADTIVVHTCSFIEAAKKESITTIMEAAQLKKDGKQLIVTGCLAQQHGKELMEELPEVDAFLGTGQLAQIPDLVVNPRARFLDRRNPGGLTDPDAERMLASNGVTATLRLSEGCSHPCSFCVIPKLRGGLQSRPEPTILKETERLAEKGVEELVIIGQDTGDWGRDLYGEKRLPQLLRKIRDIKGLRWIRLMYMHPHSFSDDLLDVFAESPDMFPYLDMPLQHIDHDLLMDMKRKLGEKELRHLVEKIRRCLPDLSLRTTFIVGYPGETDAQFATLYNFVKEGHFDYLGAFTYSQEESTPAALKPQIPEEIKQERHAALTAAYADAAAHKAEKRLGTTETILLEENDPGDDETVVYGRTKMEAPDIDAVVRLNAAAARGGRFIQARLDGYDAFEYTAVI